MIHNMTATLYLVQTIPWVGPHGNGDWSRGSPRYRRLDDTDGDPLQTFFDPDSAEAFRADRERKTQAEVNPFEYCDTIEDLTHFDADRWHDWILDAGLEPPFVEVPIPRNQWVDWWREQYPQMSELQRARMWQAMSKLRFYRVIELQAASGW